MLYDVVLTMEESEHESEDSEHESEVSERENSYKVHILASMV